MTLASYSQRITARHILPCTEIPELLEELELDEDDELELLEELELDDELLEDPLI